jgi:hypothetical protein
VPLRALHWRWHRVRSHTPGVRWSQAEAVSVSITLAACLLLAPAVAIAEGDGAEVVAAARAVMDVGTPAKARLAVETALRGGEHDEATTARLYAMAGEIAAALGDEHGAEMHFRRMLAIDPSLKPRRGYASAIPAIFARAQTAADRAGRLRIDVKGGDNGGVIVRVTSDPVAIVSGAWAEYTSTDGQTRRVLLPGRGGTAFLLPGRDPGTPVVAGVVDEYGNRLAQVTVRGVAPPKEVEPAAPAPRAKARPARADRPEPEPAADPEPIRTPEPRPTRAPQGPAMSAEGRPLYRSWALWAGLATTAAGAGAYFAWDTGRAHDEAAAIVAASGSHSYDDLVAVEDRGRRSALLANVCLGAAAGLAVTSVVMAIMSHDDDRAAMAGNALVPRVHVRGRGVALGWEF